MEDSRGDTYRAIYTVRYVCNIRIALFPEEIDEWYRHVEIGHRVGPNTFEGSLRHGKKRAMNTKTIIDGTSIEQGSNNPYADLGMPAAEAMLVKAELAREIGQIIKGQRLTQQQAAAVLGMTQPKLSELLRGRFRGISQTKMIECLNRLGRDVNIVIHKANRRAPGHTQVLSA